MEQDIPAQVQLVVFCWDKITNTQILLLLLVHFSPQSDKTVHVFLAFLGEQLPHFQYSHHHH